MVNYFKKEIEEGRLTSGDKLPSERELQQKLSISRFSLREGLARLSALGIIKIVHGKGAFVANEINRESLGAVLLPFFSDQNDRTLKDLCEARLLLEGQIAVLAARRRSNEDLAVLQEILLQSENALDNPVAFGELDHQFHLQLTQFAGNIFFYKMLDVINDHIHSFLRDHAEDSKSRKNALKGHWKIFECIKKGDAGNIEDITRKHIMSCMKHYKKHVLKKRKNQI